MGIVFFCQSCGARFDVDKRMAGKRGHCKKCGQLMTIPRAEEIASMTAIPALAMANAAAERGKGNGTSASAAATSASSWLKGGLSNAALAPITLDRMPAGYNRPTKPSPLDDAEDSKPYVLAKSDREYRGPVHRHDSPVLYFWRRQMGRVQKVFRSINQAAYLFSVPFILMLIVGAAVQSHKWALLGATAVVLLNIARIVTGAINLAVVPLRDGINVKKMKKPFWRIAEPALTIAAVVIAWPWISPTSTAKGNIAERIRQGAKDLKQDIRAKVGGAVDVDKLESQVQEQLKLIGDKAKEIDGSESSSQAQEKLDRSTSPRSGRAPKSFRPSGANP
jgi:hypothetical protein